MAQDPFGYVTVSFWSYLTREYLEMKQDPLGDDTGIFRDDTGFHLEITQYRDPDTGSSWR